MIGGWELIVILFVVLILFGGKKLPEFARNLGKGMREFKRASQGLADEEETCSPSGNTLKSSEPPSSESD